MMFLKETAGNKFAKKDAARIDAAPKKSVLTFQQAADRGEKTCCAIDRKHPDRGASDQSEFFFLKGMKCCEYDFHAPTQGAAYNKFIFHMRSMD